MKTLRCSDVSVMACDHVIEAATIEEVIDHARAHSKECQGWTAAQILPEMIALWRSRIKDVPPTTV